VIEAREAPFVTVVLLVVVVRLKDDEVMLVTTVALWYDVIIAFDVSYWVT
jgi:hypothetical protein